MPGALCLSVLNQSLVHSLESEVPYYSGWHRMSLVVAEPKTLAAQMAAGKHQHLFAKSRHYVLQMSDSWLHRFCHPTGCRCKVPQLHSSDPFMQNLETGQRKRLQPWIAQAWPSCFLASVFHETLQNTSPLPYQRSLLCSNPAMSRCAVA